MTPRGVTLFNLKWILATLVSHREMLEGLTILTPHLSGEISNNSRSSTATKCQIISSHASTSLCLEVPYATKPSRATPSTQQRRVSSSGATISSRKSNNKSSIEAHENIKIAKLWSRSTSCAILKRPISCWRWQWAKSSTNCSKASVWARRTSAIAPGSAARPAQPISTQAVDSARSPTWIRNKQCKSGTAATRRSYELYTLAFSTYNWLSL